MNKVLRLFRRTLFLVGMSTAASGYAAPNSKLDTPYIAGAAVELRAQQTNTWLEIYEVAPTEIPSAIAALAQQGLPPKPAGVAFTDALFASHNQKEIQLATRTVAITRNREALSYTESCATAPAVGDVLTAEYASAGGRVRVGLSATFLERFAFVEVGRIGQEPRLDRVDHVTKDNCNQLAQDRILFQGTLSFRTGASRVSTVPVLIQLIWMAP